MVIKNKKNKFGIGLNNKVMKWTCFMDAHSGGKQKLDWSHIYVELPEDEATIFFQNRFKRNPSRVTCTCCGSDYSIIEGATLLDVTGYERNCRYAYFDAKDNEVDQTKAWICGDGFINGCSARYIDEADTKCNYREYISMPDFLKLPEKLIIHRKDIENSELKGSIRQEGYIWRGE